MEFYSQIFNKYTLAMKRRICSAGVAWFWPASFLIRSAVSASTFTVSCTVEFFIKYPSFSCFVGDCHLCYAF